MKKLMGKYIPSVRFITRKWAPAVGGMETYCLQLTEHIQHDVDLDIQVLPGKANGNAPSGINILMFGLKMTFNLMFMPKTDVTHVSDIASWPLALIAKLRHWKTQIIMSAHGSDLSYGERSGILPKLYKLYVVLGAHLLPDAIILANSKWISVLASDTGFEDVRIIPLASNQTVLSEKPPRTRALFFAGRIIKSKGASFIVEEVLPHLPDDMKLRIAGTVWEAEEGRILKHPRVEYLGQLDAEGLTKEYASAEAVLVPSLAPEGFGLVAVEAALAGGVVIASDHTGLSEVCAGGVGLLAKTGVADAWVDKIKFVSNLSSEDRESFIKQAQFLARERYNWQRVARETLEAYSSA